MVKSEISDSTALFGLAPAAINELFVLCFINFVANVEALRYVGVFRYDSLDGNGRNSLA